MKDLIRLTILSLVGLLSACKSNPPVDIVTTIKPIQMLTTAIAGSHLSSVQLIPDGTSAHHYALKPSNIRQLQSAKLVLRIGAGLEQVLNKPLQQLPTHIKQVSLAQVAGIKLHSLRSENDKHAHNANDMHQNIDLHIWLDPNNAIAMSRAIAEQLKKIDPSHSQVYATNLQQLITKIRQTDQQLMQKLQPIKQTAMLTFHNAWASFQQHYAIQKLDTISSSSIKQLSLSKLKTVAQQIKTQNVVCLVNDQNEPSKILQHLSQQQKIKIIYLDALGADIPLSDNSYIELLEQTATRFLACQ